MKKSAKKSSAKSGPDLRKAPNAGPLRGNNSFPVSNRPRPNNSSRGGGGAAGDSAGPGDHAAQADQGGAKGGGKGKPA